MCCYCRYKNHSHVVCCHISPCFLMFNNVYLCKICTLLVAPFLGIRALHIFQFRAALSTIFAQEKTHPPLGVAPGRGGNHVAVVLTWYLKVVFITFQSNIILPVGMFEDNVPFLQVWHVTCSLEGIDICLTWINLTHLLKACKFGEDFCLPIFRSLGTRSRPRVTRVQTSMTSSNFGGSFRRPPTVVQVGCRMRLPQGSILLFCFFLNPSNYKPPFWFGEKTH